MYNFWNLKWYDIVNYFSGEESDFETDNRNRGRDNITALMEIEQGKMLQKIPSNILRLFEIIKNVLIEDKEYVEGTGTILTLPFPYTKISKVKVEYVTEGFKTCQNICDSIGTSVSVYAVSGSDNQVYVNEDLSDYDVYCSYTVDSDNENFQINELRSYLHDAVCCIVGLKLLNTLQQDQFTLVDYVCGIKFEPTPNWTPMEIRRLKFWKSPYNSNSIISGKFWRG